MSEENQAKSQTVHISFTTGELAEIDRMAGETGLRRPAYIRQVALGYAPKAVDYEPLRQHTMEVSRVLTEVDTILSRQHPDRWTYQADIERIEELLKKLLATELELNESMIREEDICQS